MKNAAPIVNFEMVSDFKCLQVLGYTTDFNQCECCGRTNLAGTVSILDLRHDVVVHFGTSCAVSAKKYDTLDAVKEAKREVRRAQETYKNSLVDAWRWARKMVRAAGLTETGEIIEYAIAEILKYRNSDPRPAHSRKVVLFEGTPVPAGFRLDLDAAGLCHRVPLKPE